MKKGREAATEKNIHNPSEKQIYDLGKKWVEENTETYSKCMKKLQQTILM
jgi:hypothetical protein